MNPDMQTILDNLDPVLRDQLSDPSFVKALKQKASKAKAERALELYAPYEMQKKFHGAGASFRERLLLAANQTGKTLSASAEVAMHATGRYPDWWIGKRYNRPTVGWVVGLTSEAVRDTSQRLLCGRPDSLGTGFLPPGFGTTSTRAVANAFDTLTVEHVAGGKSTIGFKSCSQGREKFQGETLDYVWMDEEGPEDIWNECLTRLTATRGMMIATFTPLLGLTEVVSLFYPIPTTPERYLQQMTIFDVDHIPPAERDIIIARLPPHERDSRTRGIPQAGASRVYQISESELAIEAFTIPKHWQRIGGIDMGTKNLAAVRLAIDPDSDVVYVTHASMIPGDNIASQAAFLKGFGQMRWAWPHDGNGKDRSSGETFANLFKNQGLDMLDEHATHAEVGGFSVEPGISEIYNAMTSGQFKVFSHLEAWFSEFRNYSRDKQNKIIKRRDHLVDASRIAFMMRREADVAKSKGMFGAGNPIRRNLNCGKTRN